MHGILTQMAPHMCAHFSEELIYRTQAGGIATILHCGCEETGL